MDVQKTEIWDTKMVPRMSQFRAFQQVLDRTHSHWDLKNSNDDHYTAEVRRHTVNDFVFTELAADPLTGNRTISDIRQSDHHYFCLLYLEAGDGVLRQGPNESKAAAGSIALWDSTRPAFFGTHSQFHQFSLLIPHEVALQSLPGIEDLCGLNVDGNEGTGALLLSHLRQLHDTIDTIDTQDRPAILRATVDLMAAAFRPSEEKIGGTAFRRALLTRVQEHIIENLGEPDLGPQNIAAAFCFSPRYLHRLFNQFDMTVSDWIKRSRLFRSRSDMETPYLDGLSITQIAMKNGFKDSSHFSRVFKQEFSMSPRAYRNQAHNLRLS
ncbi:helix-turn-helix domain-containing protein [Sphingorhabdus sp. Alg231-15]|uniref:helix-turn-helix domain-containing protein n=1 Tax=Sphingorhabdus sp. Alg231-15 TaxID=1922222 RepID=UPI000D560A8E